MKKKSSSILFSVEKYKIYITKKIDLVYMKKNCKKTPYFQDLN